MDSRKVQGIKETLLRTPTAREFRTFGAWATSMSFRTFAIPFPWPWPWGIRGGVRFRIRAGDRAWVGTRGGLGIWIWWVRTEEKVLVLWWVEICWIYRLAFLRSGVSLPFPFSSFDRSFSFASKILFAVPILEKEDVNTWLNETKLKKSFTVSWILQGLPPKVFLQLWVLRVVLDFLVVEYVMDE